MGLAGCLFYGLYMHFWMFRTVFHNNISVDYNMGDVMLDKKLDKIMKKFERTQEEINYIWLKIFGAVVNRKRSAKSEKGRDYETRDSLSGL